MSINTAYETVIGLEVHAQLLTQSKLFCGDSIAYGAEPNTQVSPITLAHPGTLPMINKKAVEYAIKTGLACHCEIERNNYFARKNYFYPDLPKGYQVSQHTTPICKGGYISVTTSEGEKNIRLNRIHLEEDAGKSLHDADDAYTSIDLNRAGTPLIEIVTEPDLRSSEEVFVYLTELRKLVRQLEVCDGNMEEGSLRCDVNISVRKKGDEKLGTKTEVKNLNSIRHAKRAVELEAKRLIGLLEKGEAIQQETRSFDADNDTTFSIRVKEDADDYRYFPDPDLPVFHLEESFIEKIRQCLPELQPEKIKRFEADYQLSAYDAAQLTEEKSFANFFEKVLCDLLSFPPLKPACPVGSEGGGGRPKAAANWMLGPVRSWLNEKQLSIEALPLSPMTIAAIIKLVEEGSLSFSTASARLFPHLLDHPNEEPAAAAAALNLLQQSDASALEPVVDAVLQKLDAKVAEYKKGKKGLLALFVGEIMKETKGKADPKVINKLLVEKLNSI